MSPLMVNPRRRTPHGIDVVMDGTACRSPEVGPARSCSMEALATVTVRSTSRATGSKKGPDLLRWPASSTKKYGATTMVLAGDDVVVAPTLVVTGQPGSSSSGHRHRSGRRFGRVGDGDWWWASAEIEVVGRRQSVPGWRCWSDTRLRPVTPGRTRSPVQVTVITGRCTSSSRARLGLCLPLGPLP